MLAAILSFTFVLWRFGKESQWAAESEDRFQPSHLLTTTADGGAKLTSSFGGGSVSKVNGVGVRRLTVYQPPSMLVPRLNLPFERA